jgi:hypothetical protein
MPIPIELIPHVLEASLEEFFRREARALADGVSERNNCGRLSIYMQRAADECGLANYFADTEYNRKQDGQIKTILDDDMKVITINCDLILHSRGESIAEDNLIAIEMKKSQRCDDGKIADRDRLRAMTKSSGGGVWSNDGTVHPEHVCGYRLGVYIEIDSDDRKALIEHLSHARGYSEITVRFNIKQHVSIPPCCQDAPPVCLVGHENAIAPSNVAIIGHHLLSPMDYGLVRYHGHLRPKNAKGLFGKAIFASMM